MLLTCLGEQSDIIRLFAAANVNAAMLRPGTFSRPVSKQYDAATAAVLTVVRGFFLRKQASTQDDAATAAVLTVVHELSLGKQASKQAR